MSSTTELILNYNDACIYRSDLSLLQNPCAWINDACINFQMTRLQQQEKNEANKESHRQNNIFLDPSVISYFMHQCVDDDDITDFLNGNNLLSSSSTGCLCFIPINDNNAASAGAFRTPGGGSHWSLLVMASNSNKVGDDDDEHSIIFLHFDSCRGRNETAAVAVAMKLSDSIRLVSGSSIRSELAVMMEECRAPQQDNGYDCGIFTLAAAEAISSSETVREASDCVGDIKIKVKALARACEDSCQRFVEISQKSKGSNEFGVMFRRKILEDIMSLAKQR